MTTSTSLLFLYKNIVRNFSELKALLQSFERKFGMYHLVFNGIKSMTVAVLIMSGVTKFRLREEQRRTQLEAMAVASNPPGHTQSLIPSSSETSVTVGANSSASVDIERYLLQDKPTGQVVTSFGLTTYDLHVTLCVMVFVLSNIFVFLKCDGLPKYADKLRHQMFKMNIKLACLALDFRDSPSQQQRHQRRRPSRIFLTGSNNRRRQLSLGLASSNQQQQSDLNELQGATRRASSLVPPSANLLDVPSQSKSPLPQTNQQRAAKRSEPSDHLATFAFATSANEWPELDEIWLQYDHFVRISEQTNLRFASGVFYSKRCLLGLFGRLVSLTLLSIEAIDMYLYIH